MKKAFKSAVLFAIPLSMYLFGSVTASAAPAETTESIVTEASVSETTMPPVSETENAESTTIPEGAVPETEETSAPVTETTTTTALENPFENGMLADDELFSFITDYLNDGVSFDVDGSGVLIGEDILNPEVGGEDTENAETEKTSNLSDYYSGEKLMYTVATRDGNIFYIIIDKSGVGENVYFLNSVDFTDLAALVDTSKETFSKAETDILQAANESVTVSDGDEAEADDTEDEGSNSVGSSSSTDNTASTSSGGNNTMYIVLAVAAIGIIGVAAYFKVGPGKKKAAARSAFDEGEDEDESDDDEDEEYYVDEPEEDEQSREAEEEPQEESYDEDE